MQPSFAIGVHTNRLALSLMGAVAILFAAIPIGYNALFLANSQVATGIAVGTGRELTDNTKGSRPAGTSTVVEFTTAAGKTLRFDGGSAVSSRYTDMGDHISVRYDPEDPEHAVVDQAFLFIRLTYLPLISAAFGVAALLAGGWAMVKSRIGRSTIR